MSELIEPEGGNGTGPTPPITADDILAHLDRLDSNLAMFVEPLFPLQGRPAIAYDRVRRTMERLRSDVQQWQSDQRELTPNSSAPNTTKKDPWYSMPWLERPRVRAVFGYLAVLSAGWMILALLFGEAEEVAKIAEQLSEPDALEGVALQVALKAAVVLGVVFVARGLLSFGERLIIPHDVAKANPALFLPPPVAAKLLSIELKRGENSIKANVGPGDDR